MAITALPLLTLLTLTDATPTPATDDWPFLYLYSATIQPHYLIALAFVLLE